MAMELGERKAKDRRRLAFFVHVGALRVRKYPHLSGARGTFSQRFTA